MYITYTFIPIRIGIPTYITYIMYTVLTYHVCIYVVYILTIEYF